MNTPVLDAPLPRTAEPSPPAIHMATDADIPAGKRFDVDCELAYDLTGDCDFLFQIHALNGMGQQLISESLEVTPAVATHIFEDPTVHHRFLRLRAGAGPLTLRYRAQVRRLPDPDASEAVELPIADLPDDILHNLMPTRYCESDLLGRAAQKLFCGHPPGFARVQAICDWIHDNIDYQVGATVVTTTARDVFLYRAGVCRDFAHLGITFCRALNIPARLVVGYARFDDPPPDFHAVFEAYLGGQWVLFDPTRMSPMAELIRIAMGRDAKDVAFATIFGPAVMTRMNPCLSSPD
ncbi:transglutaminase family protein [Rhizobacter sp. Root1221]|uniref:transglutaminase-like domain-containing protein n=1 Tax=Rhizobacter sp. Root1221 TaxID=1736433 RepID=UPI000A83F1EB|nr:transglutaminase family protein [Rhizobacter sp. Root1221]